MVPATDFQIPKTHHSESLDHYTRLIAGGSRHTVSWEVPGALHTRISSCDYRTITSKLSAKTCTAVYVASSSSGTIKSEDFIQWIRNPPAAQHQQSDERCLQKPAIQFQTTLHQKHHFYSLFSAINGCAI